MPEALIPGGHQVVLEGDTVSLPALIGVVESGLGWWRTQLSSGDTLTRAQAASAIADLTRVLGGLSTQLQQGTATVRVTGRLQEPPAGSVRCPHCGQPNRPNAQFCHDCGEPLSAPQPAVAPRIAALSDVGRTREMNQDTVLAEALSPQHTLLIAADGMGGHAAGDLASRTAVDAARTVILNRLQHTPPTSDADYQALLRTAIATANGKVYALGQTDPSRRGMGTTLTIALVTGGRAHIAHVGDSRAYLLGPHGDWAQLTTDHSLVARLVDVGQITPAEARNHPQRSLLYRALGTDPSVTPDVRSLVLSSGAALLLCSDGLHGQVEEHELVRLVFGNPVPASACTALVALANKRGGPDNIGIALLR